MHPLLEMTDDPTKTRGDACRINCTADTKPQQTVQPQPLPAGEEDLHHPKGQSHGAEKIRRRPQPGTFPMEKPCQLYHQG